MSFLCNSSPRCVHADCTISTCLCRMHSQPEHLVNFILFFPFNFSAPPFFSVQFFHSFFFYSYLRSIFLLVHVFFEWNITGRVQKLNNFHNFLSQLYHSQPFYLKHVSLCLWSYILMTLQIFKQELFSFSPHSHPYSIWLQSVCEVEKNGPHCW